MQLIEYKLPWQPKYRTVIDFKKTHTQDWTFSNLNLTAKVYMNDTNSV